LKGTDRFIVEGVVCTLHGNPLRVANLSVGGFFAATDAPPPLAELLELDLTLKGRPPFRVMGKVMWINDAKAPRSPDLPRGFGFKIQRIALPDKIALVDFLKRASAKTLKGPAPPARS
jgi:Tfp pilus assembly protein PilZ